jgi:hypothetical protein
MKRKKRLENTKRCNSGKIGLAISLPFSFAFL